MFFIRKPPVQFSVTLSGFIRNGSVILSVSYNYFIRKLQVRLSVTLNAFVPNSPVYVSVTSNVFIRKTPGVFQHDPSMFLFVKRPVIFSVTIHV